MSKIANSLLVFVLFFLVACSPNTDSRDSFPDLYIPAEDINSNPRIELISHLNSYKFGENVAFDVFNDTNNPIQFSPENNIYLYQLHNGKWIEIDNGVNYLSIIEQIPSKADDPLGTGSLMYLAIPETTISTEPVTVRLVVIGNLCNNDRTPTSQKSGAYIDFTLSP